LTAAAASGRNWRGPWRKTPGRLLGTGLVRLYQLTLSGFIGNSCRHLPTCSEYAYEAIARHGLWKGGWLAFFRVGRCGPGGTHGIDNVPETLDARLVWWAPWRFAQPAVSGK
jgi:putative membrane protein insertion efficiency factor